MQRTTDNKQLTPRFIHHFLENSAHLYPDKIAVIHEDVRATYAEINAAANQLAVYLVANGISRGDRVVVVLENSLEYVISYYGVLKAGAVFVSLSTDIKPDGLLPLLNELEPEMIISSGKFERLLHAADLGFCKIKKLLIKNPKMRWNATPFSVLDLEEIFQQTEKSNPDQQIDPPSLASIIYTSGSMGKPKGVMLSHDNIVSNTASICSYLELTKNDIQMVVLPFFYVMGKSLLNTHFAVGGTVVINNKFAFPATVIHQMVEEKVTGFSGVPSTYAYLLHRSPLEKYCDRLNSLRYCSQAGGHMSKQIKEELRRVLPAHTKIYIMYGATEASARLTYLSPDRFFEKIGSIGKSIPGVTMKVLDQNGNELPAGQAGELAGKGPNVMMGYWKDQDATSKVLDHHGYHTGDQGYMDEDGYFYVTGRKDSLIKVGGHRINLQEIEDILMETGLVTEAAVLGIPDHLLGNKLIALFVPKDGDINESLLLSRCHEKLPKYKIPNMMKSLKRIPKYSSGKIDKVACLEIAKKNDQPQTHTDTHGQ